MKQSSYRHGIWALITLSAWIASSLWPEAPPVAAEKSRSAKRPETKEAHSNNSQKTSIQENRSSTSRPGSLRADAGQTNTPDNLREPREEQLSIWAQKSVKATTPIKRRLAFDRLLQQMSSLDTSQLIALRSNLVQSGASDELQKLFDYSWAAKHPDSALEFLDQITNEQAPEFLANMLPGLASSDPETAISLFEGLDKNLKEELRANLYKGLIHHDEAVATNYIFDSANPKQPDWRLMDTFTRELVSDQGINETLDWAQTLPTGPLRGNAWSAAYARWTTENPILVAETLQDMPVSADRDQAINGFISALAGKDPKTAVTWAAEINQPSLRDSAMIRAGKRYFQEDPKAATDWFASSGLPPGAFNAIKPHDK